MNQFFNKLTILFTVLFVVFFFGVWWMLRSFHSTNWDQCKNPFVVYGHMSLEDIVENRSIDLFANGVQSTGRAFVVDTFFDAETLWPDPFEFWKFSEPDKSIYKREKVIYLQEGSNFQFVFDPSGVCVNRQPSKPLKFSDAKILWNETEIGDTFEIPHTDFPQDMLFQIFWKEKFEHRFKIRLEWLSPEEFLEKRRDLNEGAVPETQMIKPEETFESLGVEVMYEEANDMTIVKMDPSQYQAQIETREVPGLISSWTQEGAEGITLNGSYFHEDFFPSGYLVVDGNRVGTRKFDENKTGLFVIKDGEVQIRDLSVSPIAPEETFEYALQSYPFLIKQGVGAIQSDSGKKARRTAVGLDEDGFVYAILVNDPTVSLYEFMKILEATEIPFQEVLNLDGGPSSGMFVLFEKYTKRIDSQLPVPNVLRFQRK